MSNEKVDSNVPLISVDHKWDRDTISIFFQELGKSINEWHGSHYVNNQRGGFLAFYWHFVRCKNKPFEFYLQIQDDELKIRIIMKEEKSDKKERTELRKKSRKESIAILNHLLTDYEWSYIIPPKNLGTGRTMAIKEIAKKDWLMTNSEGFVDFDATAKKLTAISSILDRIAK